MACRPPHRIRQTGLDRQKLPSRIRLREYAGRLSDRLPAEIRSNPEFEGRKAKTRGPRSAESLGSSDSRRGL